MCFICEEETFVEPNREKVIVCDRTKCQDTWDDIHRPAVPYKRKGS